jgi:tellurite resistance protein TehA-like permease
MTPVWIFPCYPLLVIGPHAGALAEALRHRPLDALNIIVGGFVFQGIGFLLSLMIYAAFIYRLMTEKLPQENLLPGMFVSVGPASFCEYNGSSYESLAVRWPREMLGNWIS